MIKNIILSVLAVVYIAQANSADSEPLLECPVLKGDHEWKWCEGKKIPFEMLYSEESPISDEEKEYFRNMDAETRRAYISLFNGATASQMEQEKNGTRKLDTPVGLSCTEEERKWCDKTYGDGHWRPLKRCLEGCDK